jgi:heat shock protein 4
VSYCGDTKVFTVTEALGMLFTKMRQIVELNAKGVQTVDTVISVPCYFTDTQRRAVKDAATIGGLNCLRVLNDGTAVALSYGIGKGAKKEFPEGKTTNVLFLDMGASQFTATAVGFTNSSLKILASVSDSSFGGRDIDVAIAKSLVAHFATVVPGADAWKNKKARLKLLIAAEKAKITLSPHGVCDAPINVECLMEDRDLSFKLTAEALDALISDRVNAAVGGAIARCLKIANLTSAADFSAVELVGGSMRPRAVKRAAATALGMPLDEATSHGLSQSMNLDEAVARGCAFACAMLSPVFKVTPFEIIDAVPASIRISWDAEAASAAAGADMEVDDGDGAGAAINDNSTSVVLFKTGDETPLTRLIRLKRNATFDLSAEYDVADPLVAAIIPAGSSKVISKHRIEVPASEAGASTKVRVDFKHDMNGMLNLLRADLIKEVAEVTADAAMDATAPAADGAAPEPPVVEAEKKKKKTTKVQLVVVPLDMPGMTPSAVATSVASEKSMIARDNEIHATQDARNSLEASIYSTRSALESDLQNFSVPAERESLSTLLGELEEWLYNDGFSVEKAAYISKLAELNAKAGPMTVRKTESEGRYVAVSMLKDQLEHFKDVLSNKTGKHGHLAEADLDTLKATINGVERWLKESTDAQSAREMYQDPAFKVAEVNAQKDRLIKELGPIERRPVPKPAAPPAAEAPAPPPAPPAADAPVPAAEAPAPAANPEVDVPMNEI